MKNGIANVRDLAAGSLGVLDRRLVLRSSSGNLYQHISFLLVDSSTLLAIFPVSGKIHCDLSFSRLKN